MRHFLALFMVAALLALAGCGTMNPFPQHVYSTPPKEYSSVPKKPYDPKTRPYMVMGKTYYPLKSADGYDEVGMASWYGKDFHGNKTANGEIYNMYALSAAHKTLPLGTQVRVTNLENSESVILTINDRGPFVAGRILDLSYGAADKLGTVDRGVVKVRITALASPSDVMTASAPVKFYHVRVGAFAIRENAEQVHDRLVAMGYQHADITMAYRDGRTLHIVQAGSFDSREKAEQTMAALKAAFPSCYIIS